MNNSEKFCLRWNDFESNINKAFIELREDKEFFDVTLVCDEDQIQAHKVILSACSPFFRSVLRRNRHEHPLLYMKGVKYVDMLSVLNFMYQGEVNISQEDLNSFLSVAEDLQVKGLTQSGNPSSSKAKQVEKPIPSGKVRETQEYRQTPPQTNTRVTPAQESRSKYSHQAPTFSPQDDDIQEIVPVKSEPGLVQQNIEQGYVNNTITSGGGVVADPNSDDHDYQDTYEDYDYDQAYQGENNTQQGTEGTQELDALVEQMMSRTFSNGQTEFICNVCKKVMRKKRHMMCHVETHIEGVTHVCNICNKTFKTRNSLDKHRHTYHKGEQQFVQNAVSVDQSYAY